MKEIQNHLAACQPLTAQADTPTTALSDRRDQATIVKTMQAKSAIAPLPISTASLAGRVTEGEIENPSHFIQNQLEQIPPAHSEAVERALTENPPPETDYLIQVRNLVAQILAQMNHIAERDRTQIDDLKKRYRVATQEAADFTRTLGKNGLYVAAASFAVSFLYLSPAPSDQQFAGIWARDVFPKLGEMFTASTQANLKQADALASLLINEYSAKTQKGGSDANSKQEVLGILQNVLESLKRAAQAG